MRQVAIHRIFGASLFCAVALGCGTGASPGAPNTGGQASLAGASGNAGDGAAGNVAAGTSGASAGGASNGGASSASGGSTAAAGNTSSGGAAGTSAGSGGNAGAGGGVGSGHDCAGLFCEDFETGLIDAAKWDTQAMGGSVMLQSAKAAYGKFAVQFHGQARANVQSDYAFLIAHDVPSLLSKHLFGRAYFYITPKPMSGHTGMVFAGTPGFPKPAYLEVANINSGWQLGYVKLNGPPNGEEVAYPPGQVPVEKWSCLEWEFNDEPDSATLWIDGKELGKLNDQTIGYPPGHVPGSPIFDGKSSDLVGGFSDFGVGFYDWHPNNAFDLYYDDIVLDMARVGCLP